MEIYDKIIYILIILFAMAIVSSLLFGFILGDSFGYARAVHDLDETLQERNMSWHQVMDIMDYDPKEIPIIM